MMELPDEIITELKKPFDPENLKWRIQQVSNNKKTRALIIPYGDTRDYEKRLNEVVGNGMWETETNAHSSDTHAFVEVTLIINSVRKSQVGEEVLRYGDDINENAFTTAFAQAFKRAGCAYGLGSYLYQLGDVWVDLDSDEPFEHDFNSKYNGTWYGFDRPDLPKWATPDGYESILNQKQTNKEQRKSDSNQSSSNTESDSESNNESTESDELDLTKPLDFGKKEGTPANEVESWYLEYIMNEFDGDDEWVEIATQIIDKRKQKTFNEISELCEELNVDKNSIVATVQEVYNRDGRGDVLHTETLEIRAHLESLIKNDEAPAIGDKGEFIELADESE